MFIFYFCHFITHFNYLLNTENNLHFLVLNFIISFNIFFYSFLMDSLLIFNIILALNILSFLQNSFKDFFMFFLSSRSERKELFRSCFVRGKITERSERTETGLFFDAAIRLTVQFRLRNGCSCFAV